MEETLKNDMNKIVNGFDNVVKDIGDLARDIIQNEESEKAYEEIISHLNSEQNAEDKDYKEKLEVKKEDVLAKKEESISKLKTLLGKDEIDVAEKTKMTIEERSKLDEKNIRGIKDKAIADLTGVREKIEKEIRKSDLEMSKKTIEINEEMENPTKGSNQPRILELYKEMDELRDEKVKLNKLLGQCQENIDKIKNLDITKDKRLQQMSDAEKKTFGVEEESKIEEKNELEGNKEEKETGKSEEKGNEEKNGEEETEEQEEKNEEEEAEEQEEKSNEEKNVEEETEEQEEKNEEEEAEEQEEKGNEEKNVEEETKSKDVINEYKERLEKVRNGYGKLYGELKDEATILKAKIGDNDFDMYYATRESDIGKMLVGISEDERNSLNPMFEILEQQEEDFRGESEQAKKIDRMLLGYEQKLEKEKAKETPSDKMVEAVIVDAKKGKYIFETLSGKQIEKDISSCKELDKRKIKQQDGDVYMDPVIEDELHTLDDELTQLGSKKSRLGMKYNAALEGDKDVDLDIKYDMTDSGEGKYPNKQKSALKLLAKEYLKESIPKIEVEGYENFLQSAVKKVKKLFKKQKTLNSSNEENLKAVECVVNKGEGFKESYRVCDIEEIKKERKVVYDKLNALKLSITTEKGKMKSSTQIIREAWENGVIIDAGMAEKYLWENAKNDKKKEVEKNSEENEK